MYNIPRFVQIIINPKRKYLTEDIPNFLYFTGYLTRSM